MARRKNTKRIDPRYFLNETVNRGEEEKVSADDLYLAEMFDTGGVGDAAGGTSLEQKKAACAKAGGKWISDDPTGKYGHCSKQVREADELEEGITHDPRSPMEALEAKAWALAFPKAWAELKKMGDGIFDLARAAGLDAPEPEPVDDDQEMEL